MKVLLVTKPLVPPWNDSAKLLPRDLVRESSGRHAFHVLARRGERAEWPAHATRHDLYRGEGGFQLAPLERLRMLAGVWRRRGSFDALHFFFQPHPAASRAARSLARACGRPSVHTVTSAPHERHAPADVMFADRVVTLSAATARRLASALSRPAVVIAPGLAELQPASPERIGAARRAGSLPGSFVLYPGDFEFSGGYETLLEAWTGDPTLPALVLAGREKTAAAAAARAALERLARERGIADRVRFLGTEADMGAVVAASTGVLFPARSLYGKTDVPIVLLEAWRESKPVFTSTLEPLAELVEGLDATLGPDPAEWGAAARRLAHEGEARGRSGRARLLDRYTARRSAAAYEALYDEIQSTLPSSRVAR